MMIKLYDQDAKTICAFDGTRWIGNCEVHVMSKAIELIISGMKDYKARRVMRMVTESIAKPPPSTQE